VAALTILRKILLLLLAAALVAPGLNAADAIATDQQVKAVFVYNFSHFVDWPDSAFIADTEPFRIGVVGNEGFAALLQDVVRGEYVDGRRPIQVRSFRASEPVDDVHMLYVDRSQGAQLQQITALLKSRGTLTVSDMDDATRRGAMIQLANVNNRIRVRINVDSARAAGLSVSSNLLRQAEIVRSGEGE
jgi:hypothetical protein